MNEYNNYFIILGVLCFGLCVNKSVWILYVVKKFVYKNLFLFKLVLN